MRLMLVEDQALLREGLIGVFRDAGHDVVWAAGSCDGLEEAVLRLLPDVVILDVRLPPTFTDEGARAAAALKSFRPHIGVLLLSQHIETAHSVGLIGLGGFGYLLKDRVLEVSDFLSSVARVAGGGSALDPQVVAALLHRADGRSTVSRLTEREHVVLALMAQGLTNAGIAKRLWLSERTVEAHIGRVLAKLGIAETADHNRRVMAVLLHLGVRPAGGTDSDGRSSDDAITSEHQDR